jgi:hypothetical protein
MFQVARPISARNEPVGRDGKSTLIATSGAAGLRLSALQGDDHHEGGKTRGAENASQASHREEPTRAGYVQS